MIRIRFRGLVPGLCAMFVAIGCGNRPSSPTGPSGSMLIPANQEATATETVPAFGGVWMGEPPEGLTYTADPAACRYSATLDLAHEGALVAGTLLAVPEASCESPVLATIDQATGDATPVRVSGEVSDSGDVRLSIEFIRFRLGIPNQLGFMVLSGTTDGIQLVLAGHVSGLRAWSDADSDRTVDCVLARLSANGECGAVQAPERPIRVVTRR